MGNTLTDEVGEGVTHVQIGYDVETKVVGIRPAAEDAKGRYRLRTQGTNGLHVVTGKRFFAHYGLEIEKARTFTAETFESGIVGFKLTEESDGAQTKGAGKKAGGGRRSRKAG